MMNNIEADIRLIARSRFFDHKWYLSRYPDVASAGIDPVEHYVRFGVVMGRDPSPRFDTARYIQDNPDLLVLGVNPLAHYIRFHRGEADQRVEGVLRKASVRGYLDRADSRGLSGWAVNEAAPGKPVQLAVYVDDEHFVDLVTSRERPDLTKLDVDGSVAGFEYACTGAPFPHGAVIDVRVKGIGASLSRSPRVVAEGGGGEAVASSRYFDAWMEGRVREVAVVIPVFNAYDAVRDCLRSVAQVTSNDVAVMVINDCSTDERMAPMLKEAATRYGFTLIDNAANLGYTRTVNKGLALNPDRDVILLNSDTIVTRRWVEALRFSAYDSPRVATVTALSNNAGAFSAPAFAEYNPIPAHLSPQQMALVVTAAGMGERIDVPTGNGFCMYMRRDAINTLGAFDEEKYPRGYGEENDFCMRAYRAGWHNLVCDKAYVFHKRSQSFQGEKDELVKSGGRQLDQDYPEYRMLIRRFRDVQFNRVRSRIRRALESTPASQALPAIMFVVSTQTGGTPQTNLDLMRAISDRYRCKLLRCDASTLYVSDLIDGQLVEIERHPLARPIDPMTHASAEYDRLVAGILYRHSVALLHIRHIAWHSVNLPVVAKALGLAVAYSFHDFYSICPSLNLLDENLVFCGGKCTATQGECTKSLWPQDSMPPIKHGYVNRWQEIFADFLSSCDAYVTTAPSAASTIVATFPELEGKINVIPHGRDFPGAMQCASGVEGQEKIRILVPGNIGASKGSELIRQIMQLYGSERFEFHFLGVTGGILRDVGIHHGHYDRASFGDKVRQIRPAFGVVLSVWAETYCHTLTEMWACGVPVLGIDLGAVGDRIRASGAGWLVPPGSSPQEVLASFVQIAEDSPGYRERLERVRDWQVGEARWNDTRTMSERYVILYRSLLDQRTAPVKRLGLLYRQKPYVPATAYIRVIAPWHEALEELPVQSRPVDADWLLAGGVDTLHGLVIQRNAIAHAKVPAVLEMLRVKGLPYIYEIDDLLWELPPDHRDYEAYKADSIAISTLIAQAAVVTTSTPALAERIATINPAVVVIPNALSPSIWQEPIPQEEQTLVLARHGLDQPGPRILYMGTASHEPDLEMVWPALEEFLRERPDVELVQIGGGRRLPDAHFIAVPVEHSSYPQFVRWFRTISSAATMAIAPLQASHFNSMKSDIKSLDYGLAGLPTVFSDVVPYRGRVAHGVHGLLVENNTSSWLSGIRRMMGDPELRAMIRDGAAARAGAASVANSLSVIRSVLSDVYGWSLTDSGPVLPEEI
ncbi:Glycosyltransferase, GT2 family [Lysobacter spongiicola DSM 21749]|uniref:Glycosyltransferase, GT2 family n=2 Tax=Novilysobacter TaxID=3382699 RepID=A0A1T4SH30_9GAMM|nr:Glycosyltransferase, GT2 family [Lysobacter spongiicola DSM 21749]